jgi:hypothetical protein
MTYTRQELASLGKRASDLHRRQGMQLDDAVVKVASTERGLTSEHVTRITENANLITFEEMFKEADSKHVVFDLADPVEVNNTIRQKSVDNIRPSTAYFEPPKYEGGFEGRQFEVPDHIEKESSYLDVNHEFEDRQHMIKLNSAINHIESDLNRLDAEAQYALYTLTDMVKSAALQCNAVFPALQVMGTFVEDESIFEKISQVIVQSLPAIPRGEFIDQAPNYEHPIAAQYVRVEQLTKESARHVRGIKRLNTERSKLNSQFRLLGERL